MVILYVIGFTGFGIGLLIGSFFNAEGADTVEKVPFVLSFMCMQAYFFSLAFSDVAWTFIVFASIAWSIVCIVILAFDFHKQRSLRKNLHALARLEDKPFRK